MFSDSAFTEKSAREGHINAKSQATHQAAAGIHPRICQGLERHALSYCRWLLKKDGLFNRE
jgi:hypothetical protein